MKLLRSSRAVAAVVAIAASSARAATFTDPANDVFTTAGGGILDILSVEVSHTATDLMFKINLNGDPTGTDWGKYMIGIDSVAGGDTAGNGWGRPISLPAGMDYWLGSWVDSANGVQVYHFVGPWTQIGGAGTFAGGPAVPGLSITKDANSVTIVTPLSLLGLSLGSSFNFDVYTSGGGGTDSAVDALANPSQTINDWGVPYASQLTVHYDVTIPEPSTVALLGFAILAGAGFIRRRAT